MYKNPFENFFFFFCSVGGCKVYASRSSMVVLKRKEGNRIIVDTAFPLHENAKLRMQENTNTHDQQ